MGASTARYCWKDTTSGRWVGFNRTSGEQIPTNSSCIGTFTRLNLVSADGQGWYEYKSVQSLFCAKLDPGISGDPVVSYPCESGSSTATEREEHWADPSPMVSLYNVSLVLCMPAVRSAGGALASLLAMHWQAECGTRSSR